jgi:RNA-binding protein 25
LPFADYRRNRWRNVRQSARRREYQDDVRDRQQEADEKDRVERESEAFIQKQMEEMAEFEVKQRQAGLLFDDAAPVKLAIAPEIVKKDVSTPRAEDKKPAIKPKIAFEGDDDDEIDAERKKKRTLVKLDYTGDTIPEAERVAKRTARLLEIKATLPKDKRTLWKLDVQWAAVNEVSADIW